MSILTLISVFTILAAAALPFVRAKARASHRAQIESLSSSVEELDEKIRALSEMATTISSSQEEQKKVVVPATDSERVRQVAVSPNPADAPLRMYRAPNLLSAFLLKDIDLGSEDFTCYVLQTELKSRKKLRGEPRLLWPQSAQPKNMDISGDWPVDESSTFPMYVQNTLH